MGARELRVARTISLVSGSRGRAAVAASPRNEIESICEEAAAGNLYTSMTEGTFSAAPPRSPVNRHWRGKYDSVIKLKIQSTEHLKTNELIVVSWVSVSVLGCHTTYRDEKELAHDWFEVFILTRDQLLKLWHTGGASTDASLWLPRNLTYNNAKLKLD